MFIPPPFSAEPPVIVRFFISTGFAVFTVRTEPAAPPLSLSLSFPVTPEIMIFVGVVIVSGTTVLHVTLPAILIS